MHGNMLDLNPVRVCNCVKMSVFVVFMVRIFPYFDSIRRDTEYRSVFTPNAGKYRPENL